MRARQKEFLPCLKMPTVYSLPKPILIIFSLCVYDDLCSFDPKINQTRFSSQFESKSDLCYLLYAMNLILPTVAQPLWPIAPELIEPYIWYTRNLQPDKFLPIRYDSVAIDSSPHGDNLTVEMHTCQISIRSKN